MPVYTVHAPPPDRDGVSAPEKYVFVRDGFYFWAMIFSPFWMLFRQLWLVLFLYVVLVGVAAVAVWAAGLRTTLGPWPGVFLALLVGLEAGTLWRWTLSRRGWRNVGLVVGRNLEEAERRYFDRAAEMDEALARFDAAVPPSAPPPLPPSVAPRPGAPSPVIGLFPEPGAGR